jgi:hypothetical protein
VRGVLNRPTPLEAHCLCARFTLYIRCMRRWVTAIMLGLAIVLAAGCGASDRDRVAQRMEGYAHSLAVHDERAACAALTARGRRLESPGCGVPQRTSPGGARTFALLLADARAARIRVDGDHASGYLRVGRCVLRKTLAALVRDHSRAWRIDAIGTTTRMPAAPCA